MSSAKSVDINQTSPSTTTAVGNGNADTGVSIADKAKGLVQGAIDSISCDGRLHLHAKGIEDNTIIHICEQIIKVQEKVNVLNLRQSKISSAGATMLFDSLKIKNSTIKEVWIENNQLDEFCMKSLGEFIQANRSIEVICVGENLLTDSCIEILAPYFEGNTTFRQLHINGNKGITDKSIPLIIRMIESSHVRLVSINKTSIVEQNALIIPLANNVLKYGYEKMTIWGYNGNDNHIAQVCELMKKYGISKMKDVSLIRFPLTSKGASMLFDTLRECNAITCNLDVSNNHLDDECMISLGEYVQNNESLEQLDLSSNKITDKGIQILAESLIGNIVLKELDLRFIKSISDVSVPILIDVIKRSNITKMAVRYTSISDANEVAINKALNISSEEREIPINSSTKSAAKISA